MTTDRPNISVDEVGAKWGIILTSALAQISILERDKQNLLARITDLEKEIFRLQREMDILRSE